MAELSLLVDRLKTYAPIGSVVKPPALNFIRNYRQFVQVLERINGRVGLADAKREVALKVKSMIVNNRKHGTPITREKLHTLLTGDAGTGKTTFGSDLAELWAVSGCLKRSDSQESTQSTQAIVQQINPEPLAQQQLIVKETQMKSLRDVHQKNRLDAARALTQVNRLRKKVPGLGSDFQELKTILREISSSGGLAPIRVNSGVKVLPVIVPALPFQPVEFGSVALPQLSLAGTSSLPPLPIQAVETAISVEPDVKFKFGIFTRGDFIAKFQGHSTARVRDLFKEYEGGVIMIDEAYDLATTENDDFGREVLTEIINHMTRYPDKVVFIFSGYRKHMEKTILALQPGLIRRFKWKFDIPGYSPKELFQIFRSQVTSRDFILRKSDQSKMEEFFVSQKDYFRFYGGDTDRLADYVRDTMQHELLDAALNSELTVEQYNALFEEVSFPTLEKAFERYSLNYSKDDSGKPPDGMYV
jgi:hypothetical protein